MRIIKKLSADFTETKGRGRNNKAHVVGAVGGGCGVNDGDDGDAYRARQAYEDVTDEDKNHGRL